MLRCQGNVSKHVRCFFIFCSSRRPRRYCQSGIRSHTKIDYNNEINTLPPYHLLIE